jgi:bifunctional enzyme CysN/CysC
LGPRAVTAVEHLVRREERESRHGHRGAVFWLTGYPGAGKSTLAMLTERRLFAGGRMVYVLDGDNVRRGVNTDLGFSPEDRIENLRRVGEMAALFADAGFIVITAVISPYRRDRELARSRFPANFHEVYVRCDLATCEARDPKGLYAKARRHEIPDFTGVSAPYEAPERPDLAVDTQHEPPERSAERLIAYIEERTRLAVR